MARKFSDLEFRRREILKLRKRAASLTGKARTIQRRADRKQGQRMKVARRVAKDQATLTILSKEESSLRNDSGSVLALAHSLSARADEGARGI